MKEQESAISSHYIVKRHLRVTHGCKKKGTDKNAKTGSRKNCLKYKII